MKRAKEFRRSEQKKTEKRKEPTAGLRNREALAMFGAAVINNLQHDDGVAGTLPTAWGRSLAYFCIQSLQVNFSYGAKARNKQN